MRLDCYLSRNGYGSRKEVKELIKKKNVKINDLICLDSSFKVKNDDIVKVDDVIVENLIDNVLMINKPAGYISSLVDEKYPSIMNLIDEKYHKLYRLVGRLDYDTTGLLLLTDNGTLNQRLTSPTYEIKKTYEVEVNHLLKEELTVKFSMPNDIGKGEITKPAKLEIIDNYHALITITEGKYHEIKRLFGKYNYDVIALNRKSFGPLTLNDLKVGEYRKLTSDELKQLYDSANLKYGDDL